MRDRPGVETVTELHRNVTRFGLPFNVDFNKLEEAGWGIVFHEDTPQEVRAALAPLVAARRGQAKTLFKELDYKKGEQTRDWYQRQGISVGGMDPEIVPYYLLVVGPPDLIPFEFQYLLGIEYAVGRLAFDAAAEYEHYARSILAYRDRQFGSQCEGNRILGYASSGRRRDQSERFLPCRSSRQRDRERGRRPQAADQR